METTTINTNKIEEKIALTEKLGMKACNKQLRSVKELLEMKFKYTTRDTVEHKVWWQGFRVAFKRALIVSAIVFSPLLLISLFFYRGGSLDGALWFGLMNIVISGATFLGVLNSLRVSWTRMADWQYNIPYGALLAVEEAIKQGIKEFKIFYPVMESKLSDPILVGHTQNGNLVEIFNWDDGKIYE